MAGYWRPGDLQPNTEDWAQWASRSSAQQALISHTNTSVVVDTPVRPDPGDSLYETCLAMQGVMTESEAKAAWRTLAGLDTVELTDPDWEPDYAIINRLRANERQLLAENAELLRLMGVQNAWIMELNERLRMPTEAGNHDYHGPTKRDPDTGRNIPVPDPVHERFHGAVGDVIAGRVMPEARKQMQEALKSAPKDRAPFPAEGSKDDQRRIGWVGE